MAQNYFFHHYDEPLDFTGKNLVGLSGMSREELKRVIPILVATAEMERRTASEDVLTAYNGELSDEVHEFSNAKQGGSKLKKLLLKQGTVVEVMIGW